MEKIYHTNSHQKRAKLAIQMSDKIDLKKHLSLELKEDILKSWMSLYQEEVTIIKIHASKLTTEL